MDCGEDDGRLQVHEIANGNGREAALYHERLQAVLCDACHREWHSKGINPPARQVAKRLLWELRETVYLLADVRGDNLVTVEDVLKWLTD